MQFYLRFLAAVTAIVLWAGDVPASHAQSEIATKKLVPMASNTSKQYTEYWKATILADPAFNCTDLSKTNTYYLVLNSEEYNRFPKNLGDAILKSVQVFEYEEGPLRCILRYGEPDSTHKFRVIAVFDDEVVLDMPFSIGSVGFTSEASRKSFYENVVQLFKPIVDEQADPSSVDNIAPQTDKVFLGYKGYAVYDATNALRGANLVFCYLPGGEGSQSLLKQFGAQISNSIQIETEKEMAERLIERSCDAAPHSDTVTALVEEVAISKRSEPDTVEKAQARIYDTAQEVLLGRRKAPWIVTLDKNPQVQLKSADGFEARYKECKSRFDSVAGNYYDCNCAATANVPDPDMSKCMSEYAYLEGRSKAFHYIRSYESDKWKKKLETEQTTYMEAMASCAAEKYKADIVKNLPKTYSQANRSYDRMLNKYLPDCFKAVQ